MTPQRRSKGCGGGKGSATLTLLGRGGATSRRHARAAPELACLELNRPALLRCIFRVAGDVDRCSKHSSSPERQSELTVRTAEPRARREAEHADYLRA